MKKGLGTCLIILMGWLSTWTLGFGQIIENPATPKAANGGRVIVPEEILTISDEGTSDFYFKYPYNLRVGPDGSLVLRDKDQILWFNRDGRLLHNLFKKGQGPGEMQYPGTAYSSESASSSTRETGKSSYSLTETGSSRRSCRSHRKITL